MLHLVANYLYLNLFKFNDKLFHHLCNKRKLQVTSPNFHINQMHRTAAATGA